jgi:hypothetical protein
VANVRDSIRVLSGFQGETPYLPFNELWQWIAVHLAYYTELPVTFVYKLLPIVADSLIALLLYDAAADRRKGLHAGLLYAFAPVPILIMSVHQQWDSLWLYFILLSLLLVRIPNRAGAAGAGAAFILAVLAKPVAAPLALFILPSTRHRLGSFLTAAAALFSVYSLVLWRLGWFPDRQIRAGRRRSIRTAVPSDRPVLGGGGVCRTALGSGPEDKADA